MLLLPSFAFIQVNAAPTAARPTAKAATAPAAPTATAPRAQGEGGVYTPASRPVMRFEPLSVRQASREEALAPAQATVAEIKAIDAPRERGFEPAGLPVATVGGEEETVAVDGADQQAPVSSATGVSMPPSKTFRGEFLSSTSIPPDTMGAVGTTHVVTVTNDRMRIQTRDGVELVRMTLSAFWTGVTLEGGAAVSAFDPKVLYDRFNQRWILISSANAQTLSSAALFAVSQTNDPTGAWNRYAVDADPTATATGGLWIDYPTIGQNKKWIAVNENTFGYGTISGYQRADIFVLDKMAAYNGTLGSITLFSEAASNCTAPTQTKLGCGFTIAPSIVEDNTTEELYFVENWNSTSGQLRVSKMTGTAAAPVLTVGTQFPQSPNSWRFNAARILVNATTSSGGYMPQRQQAAYLPSGTRIMANDARMQNAVLRNGTLWCTHTVMLSNAPTPAGVAVGGTTNPDNHSAIQWWQIDPTIQNSDVGTPPLQRGRLEDPTADNCHDGNGGTDLVRCPSGATNQRGEFFAYPNISVNKNNDVLIGFSKLSPLTYPSAGYTMRLAADPPNTQRDQVIYRPGQANYNIGSGSGTTRQNRWGDYSAAMVDPLNDVNFWTVQEYAGAQRGDFLGGSIAGPWEVWWALVKPTSAAPTQAANLVISEFRLRGPQGANDEFIEVYNPSNSPVIVNSNDNSDGWAVGFFNGTTTTGMTTIPNGTVIPGRGHFLAARNQDSANNATVTYSLNGYPSLPGVRGADSDVGYQVDIPDNQGVAMFRTTVTTAFTLANRVDAAGFVSAPALFKEGAGIPDITPAVNPTGQISFYRDLSTGTPKDTGANETDFRFVDPVPTDALGAPHQHGAAGPENLDGPINLNDQFGLSLIDRNVAASSAPNRVRRTCADPLVEECDPNRSALGTFAFRRFAFNNTGRPVSRLRFRIVDLTTRPAPAGTADLRVINAAAPTVTVTTTDQTICNGAAPCNVPLENLQMEQPPTQSTFGGGLNTTVASGIITLSNKLQPAAGVGVNFLLGVQQGGSFRFFVVVEAVTDNQ